MDVKKNYKMDITKSLEASDNFEELANELGLKKKEYHSRKGLWIGISSLAVSMGVIIPVLLLNTAKAGDTSAFTVGTVTSKAAQQAVSEVYESSLETAVTMDNFGAESKAKNAQGDHEHNFFDFSKNEEVINEDENKLDNNEEEQIPEENAPEENVPEEQNTEEETTEVVEEVINSYHVDYVYNYSFKASINGNNILHDYETQNYTLDYQKDEDGDPLLKFSLTHTQGTTYYNNGRTGSTTLSGQYQDEVMYTTQKVNSLFGPSMREDHDMKVAYRIRHTEIFDNFSDYFISVSRNLRFIDSETENETYIQDLLVSGKAEIKEVVDNFATIAFDYDSGVAELTFDIINGRVSHAKFTLDKLLEQARENYNQTLSGYTFSIDEYKYEVEMNFTYNDVTVTKLTQTEINEYINIWSKFDHYFDKMSENEDPKDRGFHGGRNPKNKGR